MDATEVKQFPCAQCGADVRWDPGAGAQKCTNCGATVVPPVAVDAVHELDFEAWRQGAGQDQLVEQLVVHCAGCGGETTLGENVTASHCAFCGAAIAAQGKSRKQIKPASLLPFRITKEKAFELFASWVKSRWFAPNALGKLAQAERQRLRGVYLPFWTYDAATTTVYVGQRGDDYTEMESYTEEENGQTVTRTRTVVRTMWRGVSGTVENRFDDVLVPASGAVPTAIVTNLAPWDLEDLVPYADEYLAGFESESYRVDLEDGFTAAKEIIAGQIQETIRRDIGGDHQTIASAQSEYRDVTFKHILLPMWICSYRFRDKVFRFVVNARTGEVQGERPYSWIKITLLGLLVAAVVAGIAIAYNGR